ncbi:MAG: mechanosensitive ion channel family protein, partial [Pseudomonadota bacterium]
MLKIPTVGEAEKLIEEKLGGWVDIIISHIPNFIVAVIITIVFSLLARL